MSDKKLQLTVATPLAEVYKEMVDQITVTTANGEITILPDHVPLVVPLDLGQVMVKKGNHEEFLSIEGGILEVRHTHDVVILSNRADNVSELDMQTAEDAYQRAKDLMEEKLDPNETEYAALEKKMAYELNKVKIASRRGQRR
mgnify:CR=1 FL=1